MNFIRRYLAWLDDESNKSLFRRFLKWAEGPDDWWDLMGDPFIPASYKAELVRDFPERFPGVGR